MPRQVVVSHLNELANFVPMQFARTEHQPEFPGRREKGALQVAFRSLLEFNHMLLTRFAAHH